MPFTGQQIPTCYARQLAKNYRDQKLGKQLLVDDTQGVWFPKQVILDALRLPQNTNTSGISGLRFYFGAYENRADYPAIPENRRMLTLVIVQTELGEDGGKLVHKDILETPGDTSRYPDDTRKEFNDGQICPPPGCDKDGLLSNL